MEKKDETEEKKLLRQRYREKLKSKRNQSNTTTLAQSFKNDPTSALMNMGIDDPSLLIDAKNVVSNPHKLLQKLKKEGAENTKKPTNNTTLEEEEDLPPATL